MAVPVRPGESYGSGTFLPPGMSREAEQVLRVLAALPEQPGFSAGDLQGCLAQVVRHAAYWQQPNEISRLLSEPELRGVLLPVAAAALSAAGARWWQEPCEPLQHYVQWVESRSAPGTQPPDLGDAATRLEQWRESVSSNEPNVILPAAGTARWWSVPALIALPETTAALPGSGPAGLSLVEDPLAWTKARTYPLRARGSVRIYELRDQRSWQDLVERYPLDVTRTRGRSWSAFAGNPEADAWTWLIPDWSAVAQEYDGVHLSVFGYLGTAGTVLEAGAAKTMLAGWAPGETWWLTDVLEPAGEPTSWQAAVGGWDTGGSWEGRWQVQAGDDQQPPPPGRPQA